MGLRTARLALPLVLVLGLGGCGGDRAAQSVSTPPAPAPSPAPTASDVVVAVGGLGTLSGRCPRGVRSWSLHYAAAAGTATEAVSIRIGRARALHRSVNPGESVAFTIPVGGRGQPRGAPLGLDITQPTEAQTLHAVAELTLVPAAGESGRCVSHGAVFLPATR